MSHIRRKLPRIFALLLAIALPFCLPALPVRAVHAAGPDSTAQKSWLDAPARELARRIAASLPGGMRVELEVRNQSSLSEQDVSAARAALADELAARGFRTRSEAPAAASPDSSGASVVVTLSENVQGYVWVAQIQHGDDSAVIMQSVPREAAGAPLPESEKIVLRKELLWSGIAHVLDAIEIPASGSTPARLLLLELDGITAVVTDSQNTFRTELPAVVPHPRSPWGGFVLGGNRFEAFLWDSPREKETCELTPDGQTVLRCEHTSVLVDYTFGPAPVPPRGNQEAVVSLACGAGGVVLGTGTGDYTRPDTVVAYALSSQQEALSSALTLPGPVIRLSADSDETVIAVARNLQNGNYEVYRITATCGQ
ncbi:MAG: hypothetical protein ACLP1Y_16825 [Candidatus Acidiferrales bacterium]